MGKKGLGILTAMLLISLIVGWFFFSKESKYIGTSALRAVPVNSPVIAEVQHLYALSAEMTENAMWEELANLPGFNGIFEEVKFVDSLLNRNSDARQIFKNKSLVLALGFEGTNKFNELYLIELDDVSEKNIINKFMRYQLGEISGAKLNKRKYDHVVVYDYSWQEGKRIRTFSYAFHKGIFIVSETPIRVDEAIRQLNSSSLLDDAKFNRVYKTSGEHVDVNIYLNHQTFSRLLSFSLSHDTARRIKGFSNYASWTEIDLKQKSHEILLNGFTFSDDSTNNYLNIFLNQSPQRFRMEAVLPSETSFLLSLTLSNTQQFFKDYEQYLDQRGEYYDYQSELTKVGKQLGSNPRTFFQTHLDGEIAMVFTRANPSKPAENRFLVMQTKSKSRAFDAVRAMIVKAAAQKGKTLADFQRIYAIDSQTSFPVFEFPVKQFGELVFGSIFQEAPSNFVAFYGNYLIFGDSYRSVCKFLRANVVQEVLANNQGYQDFAAKLSQRASMYLWCAPGRSFSFLQTLLKEELQKSLKDGEEHLRKIESVGWQFGPENGMIYNSAMVRYNPNLREKPQTAWQSHLEESIAFKPQFVINHNDRPNREVVVQDIKNNFYLINKVGRIQWKLNLPGPIMGEIHQVDLYRNGKLQYLFNTADAIHLIDRNGNYVENFPVRLRAKATNGIGLCDYDSNKNYRIFVACADGHVYLYDKRGKVVSGWAFGKTEHQVTQPVQHYRIGNKDYIVFFDKNKTYILDRKGNPRVKTRTEYQHSMNNSFTLEKGNGSHGARLVSSDSSGQVYFLYFDGTVKTRSFGAFSEQHYFRYEDLDADGHRDFIFLDKNVLTVIGSTGKVLFSKTFDKVPLRPMQIYSFSANNRKIGVASPDENLIYLFNRDGSLYNGFPLEGNSRFSIGFFSSNNQHFNLVVGSADGFLYNYFVQ